jgi:hypothetical protein
MKGDERARHCADCNLDVYNFSVMSERQIQQILLAKNGRLCARWYRRSDGTILTADCPVGFRARVRKISLIAGTAFSAFLSMSPAAAQTSDQEAGSTPKIENSQIGSGVIVVSVMDQSGAVIPKAQVTVLDAANQSVAEGRTDEAGKFQTPGLTSGSYSVRVMFSGFGTSEAHGIVVEPNEKWGTTVHMRLNVALMGEVVTVAGSPDVEGGGDIPILPPIAPTPDAAPVPKPAIIRRLFSKIKGNTK